VSCSALLQLTARKNNNKKGMETKEDYMYKLFTTDDHKWLDEQLANAEKCSKGKEKSCLKVWNDAKLRVADKAPVWKVYLICVSLLAMDSFRAQAGVDKQTLTFLHTRFEWFIQGHAEGGRMPRNQADIYAGSCDQFVALVRNHYIHQ
jgi:hypothetical protein